MANAVIQESDLQLFSQGKLFRSYETLGAHFSESGFRQRFEQKGRMSAYLRPIPTYVITEPYPAFIGLSALLRQA